MSGASTNHGKGRRSSSVARLSSPTMSRLPSSVETPRTLCPTDPDAFAFKPDFLKDWLMDDSLWQALPSNIHKALTAVQHAGAAVLTSLERLEELEKRLPEETPTKKLEDKTAEDAIAAKLAEHQARNMTGRTRSYTRDQEQYNCAPVPLQLHTIDSFGSSNEINSATPSSGTNSTGYISPAARMSPNAFMSPITQQESSSFSAVTPFDLGDPRKPILSRNTSDVGMARSSTSRRDSEVSNVRSMISRRSSHSVKKEAPRDQASTQYHAELESFRKGDLVRLRHKARLVDVEWSIAKYDPILSPMDKDIVAEAAAEHHKCAFEEWWKAKKEAILQLDEDGKQLTAGVQFWLGWSDDTAGLDDHHGAM